MQESCQLTWHKNCIAPRKNKLAPSQPVTGRKQKVGRPISQRPTLFMEETKCQFFSFLGFIIPSFWRFVKSFFKKVLKFVKGIFPLLAIHRHGGTFVQCVDPLFPFNNLAHFVLFVKGFTEFSYCFYTFWVPLYCRGSVPLDNYIVSQFCGTVKYFFKKLESREKEFLFPRACFCASFLPHFL